MIALDSTVESIIVDGCNLESFTVLNLTRFVNLKVFEVNDDSFAYVKEVHISGLSKLDRVVIGVNCFTKYKNSWGKDSTRHFYLKDCPQLRELRLGRYSFSDYASLELKNLPSLNSLLFDRLAFNDCSRAVFESECM
ncbi:hypothetical protein WA577_006660 [Blastocystis sp. JDR]